MVTQRGICNRCNEEIKGERDGYSVSATPGSFLALDIVKGINPNWDEHYCGKECLMLVLNEKADRLSPMPVNGDSPESTPRSGAVILGHLPTGQAGSPQEEEHYEDHVAA